MTQQHDTRLPHRRVSKRRRNSVTSTLALAISIVAALATRGSSSEPSAIAASKHDLHRGLHFADTQRMPSSGRSTRTAFTPAITWGLSFPRLAASDGLDGFGGGRAHLAADVSAAIASERVRDKPRRGSIFAVASKGGGQRSRAKGKPPSLPQGEFRPKQSLGQNYLTDQNYVLKICNHFGDTSDGGKTVVELGPGTGALTQVLHERFPNMLAVDIDQRAIELLEKSMPSLGVVMSDVLQVNYTKLAELRGGPLSVIGNLPYHITSQILFTLCDHYLSVRRAVVTMQLEVAQRIVAKPSTKQYGILSVVFQLYTRPQVLFQIPPTVFYPQPSVTSALISLDFTGRGPGINQACLKTVLSSAFQQRRKMLRQSLKPLLRAGQTLPDEFATKRPEQLQPLEFVALTRVVFGESAELPQGTRAWKGMRGNGVGAEAAAEGAEGHEGSSNGRGGASVRGEGGEGGPGGYGGMV